MLQESFLLSCMLLGFVLCMFMSCSCSCHVHHVQIMSFFHVTLQLGFSAQKSLCTRCSNGQGGSSAPRISQHQEVTQKACFWLVLNFLAHGLLVSFGARVQQIMHKLEVPCAGAYQENYGELLEPCENAAEALTGSAGLEGWLVHGACMFLEN